MTFVSVKMNKCVLHDAGGSNWTRGDDAKSFFIDSNKLFIAIYRVSKTTDGNFSICSID